MLDDAAAVRGISELEAEYLGILFGLLQAVARIPVDGFGLDHRYGKVAPVPQEVVGALGAGAACRR